MSMVHWYWQGQTDSYDINLSSDTSSATKLTWTELGSNPELYYVELFASTARHCLAVGTVWPWPLLRHYRGICTQMLLSQHSSGHTCRVQTRLFVINQFTVVLSHIKYRLK